MRNRITTSDATWIEGLQLCRGRAKYAKKGSDYLAHRKVIAETIRYVIRSIRKKRVSRGIGL